MASILLTSLAFITLLLSEHQSTRPIIRRSGKVRRVPSTLQIGVVKHGPSCTKPVAKFDEVEVSYSFILLFVSFFLFHIRFPGTSLSSLTKSLLMPQTKMKRIFSVQDTMKQLKVFHATFTFYHFNS